MDTQRDFKSFRAGVDRLCAALDGTNATASDARVEALWNATRDLPLAEVLMNIDRIIATHPKGARFPKPSELRSRPATFPDAKTENAEHANVRHWEELRKSDPVAFEITLRAARAARALLELSEDDPGYREAELTQYRWSRLRYAPRAEQEAAVNAFHGRK